MAILSDDIITKKVKSCIKETISEFVTQRKELVVTSNRKALAKYLKM